MSKPPVSIRRPMRPASAAGATVPPEVGKGSAELAARPPEIPTIDLDKALSSNFVAAGRAAAPALSHATAPLEPAPVYRPVSAELDKDCAGEGDGWRQVAVKLPAVSGKKLSVIADRRGSKRTRVAIEVLEEPLRLLASQHKAGKFPLLQAVSAGTSRASIALLLTPSMADDLRHVVETRKAVKAQILARLLVPAIDALYAREVLGRG